MERLFRTAVFGLGFIVVLAALRPRLAALIQGVGAPGQYLLLVLVGLFLLGLLARLMGIFRPRVRTDERLRRSVRRLREVPERDEDPTWSDDPDRPEGLP